MATSNLHSRTYRPQDLLIISRAFDEAWASIADSFKGHEDRIASARSQLADAVLAAAAKGVTKTSHLKTMALVDFLDERDRKGTLPKVIPSKS